MSRSRRVTALALILTIVAAIPSARAQDCASAVVGTLTDAQLGAWKGFRPQDMQTRFKAIADAGAFSPVLDSLIAIFLTERTDPPASTQGLTADQLALFRAELDSARAELVAGESDRSALLRGAVTVRRFAITSNLGRGFEIFVGRSPGPIALDNLGINTQRSVCWLAMSVSDLLTKFGAPGREKLARALNERVTRWENFAQSGYSMLPIELLVTGWVPRPTLEPPRVQFILVHPSVAAQMTGESLRSLEDFARTDVLAIEPAGFVVYAPSHRWYVGGSWLVTFPASGEIGAASGLMAHLGRLGRAGYVWRRKAPDGSSRNAWVLSLDVYGYLTKAASCRQSLKGLAPAQYITTAQQCIAPTK